MSIVYTLLIGLIGFLIAKKLRLPAPAMIGSMIAVGIFNILFDIAFLPPSVKIFTQAIAGLFIGVRLHTSDLKNIQKLIKPIILLLIMFTLNTFLMGIIISTFCKIDIVTSLLSCIAGGVSDIPLIAMDMGAETSIVALIQTSRLITALLVFPGWIVFFSKKAHISDIEDKEQTEEQNEKTENQRNIGKLVLTIVVAFCASYLGSLSGMPAGSLVFSMVCIIILNCTTKLIAVEMNIKIIGQLLAGILVGITVTRETLLMVPALIIPILLLLLSFWIVNIVYGYICYRRGYIDMKSALFASCPAGASDMALIASDLGADLAKTGLIQVVRLIFSVAVMPQLINLYIDLFF